MVEWEEAEEEEQAKTDDINGKLPIVGMALCGAAILLVGVAFCVGLRKKANNPPIQSPPHHCSQQNSIDRAAEAVKNAYGKKQNSHSVEVPNPLRAVCVAGGGDTE